MVYAYLMSIKVNNIKQSDILIKINDLTFEKML